MYVRSELPQTNDVETLRRWVVDEFGKIERALNQQDFVYFQIQTSVPTKVKDGMLVFADGTSWNPGSGRGLYERRSGSWVKL